MEYNTTNSVDVEGRYRVVARYSVSTCLGGPRKTGVSHRKEIFCAEILRPFGSSETNNRNCMNITLDIAGSLMCTTFWRFGSIQKISD
jgi:hypothetical protein